MFLRVHKRRKNALKLIMSPRAPLVQTAAAAAAAVVPKLIASGLFQLVVLCYDTRPHGKKEAADKNVKSSKSRMYL